MIKKIIDFILTKKCFFCKENLKKEFCEKCLINVSINNYFFCPKCFKKTFNFKKKCHLNFNYFLSYLGDFKNDFFKKLTYYLNKNPKKILPYINFLIEKYIILNKEILENFSNKIIIIPIPSILKKFPRNFNQTEIIAKIFQKNLNSKTKIFSLIYKNALKKNNLFKINLNFQKKEKKNLNIFKIEDEVFFFQKNIILISDIFSENIINETVKILKKTKPKKILIFTLVKN